MDVRKIIKEEMDDFNWAKEHEPNINSIDDIQYFLKKPFNIFIDGSMVSGVDNHKYWLEDNHTYPDSVNVHWKVNGVKGLLSYKKEDVVDYFNPEGIVVGGNFYKMEFYLNLLWI